MPTQEEAEIAAIFSRLKDEIRNRPSSETGTSSASVERTLAARQQAERAWAVSAERPFEHPPTRGGRTRRLVVAPVKQLIRKLIRWYVEPVASQQRSFNLLVLRLVDELAERTDDDLSRLERRLEALAAQVGERPIERNE